MTAHYQSWLGLVVRLSRVKPCLTHGYCCLHVATLHCCCTWQLVPIHHNSSAVRGAAALMLTTLLLLAACCCCMLLLLHATAAARNTHRLSKDPVRWGLVEGDGVSVFYALVPPWCRSRPAADY
jgi:hypothetical protein